MENPSATPPPTKKPWPMKWIALVIVVYIAGYTFINIAYRKPSGSAHEPFAEAQERELRTVHATMQGWTRFAAGYASAASVDMPARAEITRRPLPEPLDRALPRELPPIMPGRPSLHPAAIAIAAPSRLSASDSLRVRLEFPSDASVPAFGEILAYAKDNHLHVFVQDQRRVARDAQPTPATPPLALVLPPGALTAGTWQASLYTAADAFDWTFTVE